MAEFEVFGKDRTEKSEKKDNTGKGGKITNRLKRLFKNKPFLIAVIVVAILGLWSLMKKSQTQTVTESEDGTLVPESLELMYPGENTYMTSEGDYISDVLTSMGEYITGLEEENMSIKETFNNQYSTLKNTFDVTVDDMSSQIQSLSNKVDTQDNTLKSQTETIAKQNAIRVMQNNSDAWHYASTKEERDALAKANEEIASQYGWKRGDDGVWYDGGIAVYQTVTQQKASVSSAPATGSYYSSSSKINSVQYDIRQMQANSKAWHSASETDKKILNAENQAIAKKNGWTFNSETGTYHNKDGSRVY